MFELQFNKSICQNIRESLRKEWLETNGLGDYSSSTIPCCNTRKYHGLLVANLKKPQGRHVLLSTLEETLVYQGKELPLSCRKHPGVYHPKGWEALSGMSTLPWPKFEFQYGSCNITKEILMPYQKTATLIKYTLACSKTEQLEQISLQLKPLLAFRHFHGLTSTNMDLHVKSFPANNGFMLQPYNSMPPIYFQINKAHRIFPSPDWYLNVEYPTEAERGFPYTEDLFMPACVQVDFAVGESIILAASLEEINEPLENLWQTEVKRRNGCATRAKEAMPRDSELMQHLALAGETFMIITPHKTPAILAGYHWFEAWGRDSMIALPGLTFYAGKTKEGLDHLASIGASAKNGLIPNCFDPDGVNHAYNSIDSSLWYIWAVQQIEIAEPNKHEVFIQQTCWPVIKDIINAFRGGKVPTVFVDSDGLLHAGSEDTQLTWMDAIADGKPVTPRYGCPVDINALWYNTLAFANHLGKKYAESQFECDKLLAQMREAFLKRFWINSGTSGYLADVWRHNYTDKSVRPNQIFAVSMPYPILTGDWQQGVVAKVKSTLLTPYGLRTLSPEDPNFCGTYYGNPVSRDSAYHQGTVWPWLLGAYTDAILRTSWDTDNAIASLLETISPLFTKHFSDAGLGSISEIFDANSPHCAGGCIAQAWSVAECLRLLRVLERASPRLFQKWESTAFGRSALCEF